VEGEEGDKCCYLLQHVRCHVNCKSERHFYGAGKTQIQKKKLHFNMKINIWINRWVRKKEYGLGLTPDAENFQTLKNIYTYKYINIKCASA
jgi:hypothetical protein